MPKMYSTIHKSALSQQINSTFLFQNCEFSMFLFHLQEWKECNGNAAIHETGKDAMEMQQYKSKAKAPLKFKGTFTCTYYRCTLTQVGNSQQAGSYQYCNSSNLTVKDNTDWIRCAGVTL